MVCVTSVVFLLTIFFKGGLAGFASRTRIVNGVRARPGEFPYQAFIQKNGTHHCGGSILDKYHILTAAHCVLGQSAGDLQVIGGTVNLNDLSGTAQVKNVSSILIHEMYEEENSWNNDIAILKIDSPFEFNSNLAPAKLPERNEELTENITALVTGFGRIKKNGKFSPLLLKTYGKTVTNDYCQHMLRQEFIHLTNVCVESTENDAGFCNGDSGGPLTANGKIVGVVSFSLDEGCIYEKTPQVFVRTSKFIDWISDNMN